MYVRLVRFTLAPGSRAVAEAIAREVAPQIAQQEGNQGVEVYGDDNLSEYGLIVRWDTHEHADEAAGFIGPQLSQHLGGAIQGELQHHVFEIISD